MSNDATRAMTSWIGTLSGGGIIRDPHEEAGITVAAYVVGEEPLSELREWMTSQPKDVIETAQKAAIEVCIWMANADRKLDPEEAHLIKQIIGYSRLDADTQDELVSAVHDPPSLDGVEDRLSHPVLKEMLIALSWEMAEVDGTIDRAEESFITGLAKRLSVTPERTNELRQAVVQRLSIPPEV